MRFVLAGLVLGSVVGLAACGDDSTGPEDSLTREEALALVEGAASQGFELTENVAFGSDVITPGSPIEEFTAPCPMGGAVTVNPQAEFTGDPDSEDVAVSMSVTLVHSDCMITHEGTGIAFTLDGAPNLAISVALSFMGDFGFTVNGEVNGTVRWATDDDRSGSCRIDLDIEAGIGPSGFTSTLAGQACGAQIMESDAELFSF